MKKLAISLLVSILIISSAIALENHMLVLGCKKIDLSEPIEMKVEPNQQWQKISPCPSCISQTVTYQDFLKISMRNEKQKEKEYQLILLKQDIKACKSIQVTWIARKNFPLYAICNTDSGDYVLHDKRSHG